MEGVDLVMLVMNDQGFQHLLSSKFQISGDASAAAGPVGRHASAGTDWKLNSELLTYSRSRGVFAGITLDGAVVQRTATLRARSTEGISLSKQSCLVRSVRRNHASFHEGDCRDGTRRRGC